MPPTDLPFMPFLEKMLRKTKARLEIIAPMNPVILKFNSVAAAKPQPPIIGINDRYTGSEKLSPSKKRETMTLKAGSALLIMCVNETATLDILTVAATCPIVCATATGAKAFQNSKSVSGASAKRVAQDTNIIKDPTASESVEVNQGKGNALSTFLL
eukprot:Gb_13331 [translate_table: standard]